MVDVSGTTGNSEYNYSANFLYENNVLKAIFTSAGRIVPFNNNGETLYKFEYNLQDHLGNTRVVFSGHSNGQPEVMQLTDYYPFGLIMNQQNYFADGVLSNKYLYNNKELQDDELAGGSLGWYDYGARMYDAELGRWHAVDPLAEEYYSQSPYHFSGNNPIKFLDLNGMNYDWVEKKDGSIYWDENAISQATTKQGEKYLGKNVLVGTHKRDANLNEPINSAKFELYLESNKEGPSATIMGNTVPADSKTAGTLAEGLYPARAQGRDKYLRKGKDDLAILINEGKSVPTAPGSPKSSITEIFFHSGNNYQKSLFDSNKIPYSTGCQTSGCGPGSLLKHTEFMKVAGTGFKGFYYLRSQPKLEVLKFQ